MRVLCLMIRPFRRGRHQRARHRRARLAPRLAVIFIYITGRRAGSEEEWRGTREHGSGVRKKKATEIGHRHGGGRRNQRPRTAGGRQRHQAQARAPRAVENCRARRRPRVVIAASGGSSCFFCWKVGLGWQTPRGTARAPPPRYGRRASGHATSGWLFTAPFTLEKRKAIVVVIPAIFTYLCVLRLSPPALWTRIEGDGGEQS